MTIKPVLVPDHTANDLRRLMDHFAEAATGPTRRQLTESRAAVTAARKTFAEGAEKEYHVINHKGTPTVVSPNGKMNKNFSSTYDAQQFAKKKNADSKKKRVSEGPDKGWVPNPDNPGYYIHRSDLPQTGKVSDPAKAKLSRIINKYFGQIYDYGDGDESLNYLDNNAPLWFDLFDKHDGDIDAIIANEPADVLKQAALELKNVANDLKYELDESENLNEFLAPNGSNYGGGGGGDESRQFRVIITLYDDSSAEDETAERKIGITVTATSEKAACDLATTMLLKSPRYDGSRITNVTARPVLDEQTMSRAAKGYEKYGRAGMAALAKAGREGRALDPVRDRYDRYDEAVAEGSAGAELKAIDGDYYEDSTDFFSMFDQDHFDREEESEDGMEIRGYIDDVCVMVFKFSTPDMMGGWGNYDDSALIADSGVEDDEEEGETCPECDGAGCPECYGDEDRDRAHDHAQGMERESAGMTEAPRDREDDERHDLDPSDWYIVIDGKLMKASVYPNQHDQARAEGFSPTREQARARAANKGMDEGVLGDIGSEIGHGVKGLKRTIQGKPSRQAVKDKYRDRSDAAYKAGDRKDAKKNADRWERVHNTTNDGMLEAGQPDVMRHRGDTTVKVVKRAGKPIGEIGIDAEASPGNGQYYVKLYDGSYDAVGFDTAAEALAELKAAISEGITETADGVKYGVFAKGGSVGSQRFRDDPLKTFDTKKEAIIDARRRRSALSPGERGYYRMGYVVKPIKGEVDEGMIDNIKNTVRAANYDRLARRSNSQAVAGGGLAPPAQFKSLSAKGDQRAQKAQDIRKGDVEEGWKSKLAGAALAGAAAFGGGGAQANDQIAKDTQGIGQAFRSGQMAPKQYAPGEISSSQIYSHPKWRETVQAMFKKYPKNHEDDQRAVNAAREAIKQMIQQGNVREGSAEQVDEKSESVRHGNNDHNVYHHVDESVDPVEQLRADIKRFAQ